MQTITIAFPCLRTLHEYNVLYEMLKHTMYKEVSSRSKKYVVSNLFSSIFFCSVSRPRLTWLKRWSSISRYGDRDFDLKVKSVKL